MFVPDSRLPPRRVRPRLGMFFGGFGGRRGGWGGWGGDGSVTKAKNALQKENLKTKLSKEKSKTLEAEQARLAKERKPWFEVSVVGEGKGWEGGREGGRTACPRVLARASVRRPSRERGTGGAAAWWHQASASWSGSGRLSRPQRGGAAPHSRLKTNGAWRFEPPLLLSAVKRSVQCHAAL